jgi:hypothetical protein
MKEYASTCHCGCGNTTNRDSRGAPRAFLRGHNRRGQGKGWIEGGYRYISVNGKKIAEHRHIVQQREGRPLGPNEVVHHVDGDKLNNDSSNLALLSRSEHSGLSRGTKQKRWPEEEKARARALRRAGLSIQEVAWALGRPFSSTAIHVRGIGRGLQ